MAGAKLGDTVGVYVKPCHVTHLAELYGQWKSDVTETNNCDIDVFWPVHLYLVPSVLREYAGERIFNGQFDSCPAIEAAVDLSVVDDHVSETLEERNVRLFFGAPKLVKVTLIGQSGHVVDRSAQGFCRAAVEYCRGANRTVDGHHALRGVYQGGQVTSVYIREPFLDSVGLSECPDLP
ncbi:hypothetical protein D9M69_596140 [compost metagenome]